MSTVGTWVGVKLQRNDYNRRAHIVVVEVQSAEIVSYMLSFSGAKKRQSLVFPPGIAINVFGAPFYSYSGNHPNWIHGTHDINMSIVLLPAAERADALRFDIARVSFGAGNCRPADLVQNKCPQVQIKADGAYFGSGHHVYLPGERFVLVDAYMKEGKYFRMDERCRNPNRASVPLRLVDLKLNQSKVLVEVKSLSS